MSRTENIVKMSNYCDETQAFYAGHTMYNGVCEKIVCLSWLKTMDNSLNCLSKSAL